MPEQDENANTQQQDAQQDNSGANGTQGDGEAAVETWEAWLEALPEDQRKQVSTLHETHVRGLKSALTDERQQRKDLEKQLRDAAKAEQDGSDAQKRLTELADEAALANRRADFYEAAISTEIGLTDVKGAWILVNADAEAYIDRRGAINFEALKAAHPGLFAQVKPKTPPANQGSGMGTGDSGTPNMNNLIRQNAGRA